MAASIRSKTTSQQSSNSTSHTVALPATVESGDTLLVIAGFDYNAGVISWPNEGTDWIQLTETLETNVHLSIAWKKADGTEDGTNITVTTVNSQSSAHASYAIQNAADPTVSAPELGGSLVTNSNNPNPNPGTCTPTGGSGDYLWMPCFTFGRSSTINSWPAVYGTGDESIELTVAGTHVGVVNRTNEAASEDCGSWTMAHSNAWLAATVAIYPATGAGQSPVPILVHHYES